MSADQQAIEVYETFCKELGLPSNPQSNKFFCKEVLWGGVPEYVMFMGWKIVDDKIRCPKLKDKLAALSGPHGVTMLKMYKARRYSWLGMLRATLLKPIYSAVFVAMTGFIVAVSMITGFIVVVSIIRSFRDV